jgi:hypothetical protein
MRYVSGFGGIRVVGLTMAIVATCVALGASFGSSALPKKQHIEISYPDLSRLTAEPCSAEDSLPCAMEAAALVTAIANLEAARTVAEEAFQEWSDCVDANGGPTPNPSPTTPPRTVGLTSILDAVK